MEWSCDGGLVEDLKHWSENLEAVGKVIEVLANPERAERCGHPFLENAFNLGHVIDDYVRTIYLSIPDEAGKENKTYARLRRARDQDGVEIFARGRPLLFKGEPIEDLKHWDGNVEALGRAIIALAKPGMSEEGGDVLLQFGEALGRMIYDYAKEISTAILKVEQKEKKRASAEPQIQTEAQSDPEGSEHKIFLPQSGLYCNDEPQRVVIYTKGGSPVCKIDVGKKTDSEDAGGDKHTVEAFPPIPRACEEAS